MPFESHQFSTSDGIPHGGHTFGAGFAIAWQQGPIEDGQPNGAQVEDVVRAAIDRLEFFQRSRYACHHNALAIRHFEIGLGMLEARTAERLARGVEGTHQP